MSYKYFVIAAFKTPNVRMPGLHFLSGHNILAKIEESEDEFDIFNSFQYNEFLLKERAYILLVDTSCMVVYQHTMDKEPIRFLGSFVTTMSLTCPFCHGAGNLNTTIKCCNNDGEDYLPNIIERLNYQVNLELTNPLIGDPEFKHINRKDNLF
jgi:hypothetical protein